MLPLLLVELLLVDVPPLVDVPELLALLVDEPPLLLLPLVDEPLLLAEEPETPDEPDASTSGDPSRPPSSFATSLPPAANSSHDVVAKQPTKPRTKRDSAPTCRTSALCHAVVVT